MYNYNSLGDLKFVPVVTGDPVSSGISTGVATVIATIMNSINKGKPNPNDWQGWSALDQQIGAPQGTNALQWVILDGDSVQNEALNIVQWIKNYGIKNLIGYSNWFKREITIDDIANKIARGGYPQEAAAIKQAAIIPPANNNINNLSNQVKKAGLNPFLIFALIGAGIYMFTKKKSA